MGNYVKINIFFILNVCCGKTFPIRSEWESQKAAKLYVCRANLGLPSLYGAAHPCQALPRAWLLKNQLPWRAGSKKENPVELSKSPGSIYILRLPLTVPLGWAYGDEAAAVAVLAIDWKHTPWDKVICVGELSLFPISVCFIDGT